MKKLSLVILVFMLIGCSSTRHTINRLQGDIPYFRETLTQYAAIIDTEKGTEVLSDATEILDKVEAAIEIGDKLSEKRYLSALVDIMDILEKEKK